MSESREMIEKLNYKVLIVNTNFIPCENNPK